MEINFKEGALKNLIVHYVGNKNNPGDFQTSKEELKPEGELLKIVGESFLNKFKDCHDYYSFHHATSLQYNEVYNYVSQLFGKTGSLEDVSLAIATHLYNCSVHPKVKGGELYIGVFENLPVEGRMYKAIGLFKAENKSLFLKTDYADKQFTLQMQEGMELTKMDKGCLILNTKQEEGFDVLLFDNQNRGEEAQYWKETFLGLTPQKNEFHQTNHFLTLTKQFITDQGDNESGLAKKEQIELLHKSIDYFRSNDSFDINNFQQEVFGEDDLIDSFRNFGSRYTEQHDFDIATQFDISAQAVKKQMRIYKSVLKLDRNFHIYIHGNTDLIEKGVDLDGRKYYKLYYQDEA
ncbi:MAG TPA: nucleoid-associated protein [Chitinophagaceae bacterium]|jgi:hypothetical protein|nr:nucleoid-associated protein [Chitinophagaceae bacterium]